MSPLHIARLRSTLIGLVLCAVFLPLLVLEIMSKTPRHQMLYFDGAFFALGLILLDPLAVKDAIGSVITAIRDLASALLPWKKP